MKGVIEKVKNRFNVSVAEVGAQDLWQRAEIGVSAVGADAQFVSSVVDKVVLFIEGLCAAEIIDRKVEIIHTA